MEAGILRHRLIFQSLGTAAAGEGSTTWTDTCTIWGQVEPLTGTLLFQAQQANSEASGRIKVRYRADLNASMRIKFGTRYFKILSLINPLEGNEYLIFYYKEYLD